jgi:hypothetical protein
MLRFQRTGAPVARDPPSLCCPWRSARRLGGHPCFCHSGAPVRDLSTAANCPHRKESGGCAASLSMLLQSFIVINRKGSTVAPWWCRSLVVAQRCCLPPRSREENPALLLCFRRGCGLVRPAPIPASAFVGGPCGVVLVGVRRQWRGCVLPLLRGATRRRRRHEPEHKEGPPPHSN